MDKRSDARETGLLPINLSVLFILLLFESPKSGEYDFIGRLLILLGWIGGAIYLFLRMQKEQDQTLPETKLPESFLELSYLQREIALDMAWTPGLKQIKNIPIKAIAARGASTGLGCLVYFITFVGFCFALGIFSSSIGEAIGYTIWAMIVVGSALLLNRSYLKSKQDAIRASNEEAAKAARNSRLRDLAKNFVLQNYKQWVEEMGKMTLPIATDEAKVSPDHTFVLFSWEFSAVPPSMPDKHLGVTYVFSNGFVSIVSSIVFDIKTTSYGYTKGDQPEYTISDRSTWTVEEFHYRDVVELNYSPAPELTREAQAEYPVEGYLVLGLSNGSNKKYPTTKSSVSNLLNVARDRMRHEKRSSR